jgi:RNA polymerase sigma factor (sigma-70 family)
MSFEERYTEFYPRLKAIANRYSKLSGVAVEEFISALSEEFWLRYSDYDVERLANFQSYMQTALSQRALKLAKRKEREYQQRTTSVDKVMAGFDGEDDITPEAFVDSIDVDKLIVNRIFIDTLLEGEDKTTRSIVAAKLAEPSGSNYEIADMVETSEYTVRARLKKLGDKARREMAK